MFSAFLGVDVYFGFIINTERITSYKYIIQNSQNMVRGIILSYSQDELI